MGSLVYVVSVIFRVFAVSHAFPVTKSSFSHLDLIHNSKKLSKFGEKLMTSIGKATLHQDNIDNVLPSLNDRHAAQIRLYLDNNQLLSSSIQVDLAINFPKDFTHLMQHAWNKFLSAVSSILM